jgi:flagellar hook-basal body complex protein FliE
MGDVSRLSSISGLAPAAPPAAPRIAKPGDDGEFGAALGRALADVNRMQLEAQDSSRALAEGRADVLDTVMAVQKADVAFQLVVQIRNKLVEAYQEVMRMQV